MKNHRRFLNDDHIFRHINNHQGFTLVEVLIAMLVLGILFVPVSNAFFQSVHLNQHLHQQVNTVREAQAAMEVTLAVMAELEAVQVQKDSNDVIEDGIRENDKDSVEEALSEEITRQLSEFNSTGIIEPETTVDITPLHEDSPFFIITAASPDTKTNAPDSAANFSLITLRLAGEAPWLTPKAYRVVTP